jgi:hypothetical protein
MRTRTTARMTPRQTSLEVYVLHFVTLPFVLAHP